jgi:hypothetical protein
MNRACVVVLAFGASALGQANQFEVVISNPVSPDQPSATVEVWAAFSPALYAFAKSRFDMLASADEGGFSDPFLPLEFPGDYAGDIPPNGDSVTGVNAGQVHMWNGPYADTSNPILIWSATWNTSDFHPRTVSLATTTSEYYVYENAGGGADNFIDHFVEGEGFIEVVPAPGVLPLLGLTSFPVIHRRRRVQR